MSAQLQTEQHRTREWQMVCGLLPFDGEAVDAPTQSHRYCIAGRPVFNWIKVVCLKELRSTIHSTPRYKDLSHMLDLPLEIILEILTWLHPIDLLNVCSSNKALRSLLAPDSSSTIWHTCFATYHDLPFPPAHFPPRRWAYLLFGPPTCWECGRPNTYPDFSLQRKICGKCMKHILVPVRSIRKSRRTALLPLLLRSYRHRGTDSSMSMTSNPDSGHVVNSTCSRLMSQLHNDFPHFNQSNLDAWLASESNQDLVERVKASRDSLAMVQAFYHRIRGEWYGHQQDIMDSLYAQTKTRLRKEGYHMDDIASVTWLIQMLTNTRTPPTNSSISPQRWSNFKAVLENPLATARQRREERSIKKRPSPVLSDSVQVQAD